MSLATQSPVAGRFFLKTWQVALIWIAVVVALIVAWFTLSGNIPLIGGRKNAQAAPEVQAPPAVVTPVVRPDMKVAQQQGGPAAKDPPRTFDPDRAAALASDNAAFGKGSRSAAIDTRAAGDSGSDGGKDELDPLEASLKPSRFTAARVIEKPNPTFLIRRGRILPCNQQSFLNSTLPGMVTAEIPEPIRGETGDVILIPKGAPVTGTIQHALVNGLDRVGVLWDEVDTPVLYDRRGLAHQFQLPVQSPATGELGDTGLDGDVNHHYGKKIGGILGMSLIQGAIQAGVQAASKNDARGGQTFNFNQFQQGGDDATQTLLRSWVAIPDILTRDQGRACGIGIIRDVVMQDAYRLTQNYRIHQ